MIIDLNTPGTRVHKHISSSYAKILGETNFHTREFPRVGQKQKTEAHAKPPGPKVSASGVSPKLVKTEDIERRKKKT